jgi:hypothetical protein
MAILASRFPRIKGSIFIRSWDPGPLGVRLDHATSLRVTRQQPAEHRPDQNCQPPGQDVGGTVDSDIDPTHPTRNVRSMAVARKYNRRRQWIPIVCAHCHSHHERV